MALSSASGVAGHIAVHQHFASLVEDAHVHGPGMEIDTTVKWVLIRGKSPEILCRRTGHTHGAIVKLLEA